MKKTKKKYEPLYRRTVEIDSNNGVVHVYAHWYPQEDYPHQASLIERVGFNLRRWFRLLSDEEIQLKSVEIYTGILARHREREEKKNRYRQLEKKLSFTGPV